MALTQKLNIYETSLGQVLRFLKPRPATMTAAQDKRFADMDAVKLQYEIKLSQEAYTVLQSNPLLKQKIQLDMIGIGQKIVRDRILPFMAPTQTYNVAFKLRVENALKQGEAEVNALVDGVLKRHADMNQAWGKYYKGMRKDLIFIAVGLTLTAVSVGLALPTGGASITLAIAAGVKSIAGAINKLAECWRDAEEQQQRIHKSLNVLLSAYMRSVSQGRTMQISGAVLDTIGLLPALEALPFVRQQLLPSLSKINADMSTYKGKLGHLYGIANRLAAQLFDVLDQIDEWKKAHPGQEMPKIGKLEKHISELLDSGVLKLGMRQRLTISGAYLRYEKGMAEYDKLTQTITTLNGIETNPRAIAIINMAIKVFGSLALAGGAYGASLQLDTLSDKAALGITVINDAISTANDLKDFVETIKGDATDAQLLAALTQVESAYGALPVTTIRPPPPVGGRIARPQGIAPRPGGPPNRLAPTPPPRPQGLTSSPPPPNRPPPPPPRRIP
ncbi:hypothetical protein sos41_43300 [Alphaproteobacteria bacterium SO-S41]|nr:hypothetical protein sos41_43300 [Alphaproteobacteria bacterium SO-S41]